MNLLLTRSIGRDFLLALIPTIIIVALVVGSINFLTVTKREVHVVQEQANEIAISLARITAHYIYQSNHNEIAVIGQEFKKGLNVIRVSILDEIHNIHYILGAEIQGRHILAKRTITLFNTRLGSVEVALSINSILRQQREFLYYTIVVTFFILLTVSIVSILLLEMFLRKPLSAFMDGVRAIAAGSYEHRVVPMNDPYMISIARSVNTMAKNVAAREHHLKLLVGTLEKQVVEREEAEAALMVIKERFQEMTNLLPEIVYEMDESGFISFLNRSGFERFGLGSEDIKNGLKFIDLFTPQDRDRIAENLKNALSGKVVGSSEYLVKNKNGVEFPVLVHFNPIVHDESINGIRGIAVDISERKRTEEELLLYQEKLRSLTNEVLLSEERERRQIASELHDQIGHDLTNIAMKINRLKDTDNRYEKNIILKEIDHLIEQSAHDVQSMIFEISPPILYDIGLVAAIDWLIEQTSKEHGLKMVFKHDGDMEPFSPSFRVLIFRAVRELLFNVVKHSQANNVKVSITRQDGNLLISVQDDGVGMSTGGEDSQPQAEGFGLFSIRERLSHLKGRLIVHSNPCQGTRVTMEIPNA